MKTIMLLMVLMLTLSLALSAQTQAVVRDTAGKVELLPAGQSWVAARPGMTVALGTTVSTGFNSSAVLELGRTVLQVRPLTRLRLDELIEREGAVQTELFLNVGKVRAEVRTVEGLTQDFKLRSPVSTAAVRGTGFEYSGYELFVFEGQVRYESAVGQGRSYSQGEGGATSGFDTPSGGENSRQEGSAVNPYAPGVGGTAGGGVAGGTGTATGGVILIIQMVEPEIPQ